MKNKFYSYILGSAVAFSSLTASAEGYYQIPNGDFEKDWTSGSEPGNGLHSFDLAVGSYKSQVNGHTAEQVFKVDGHQSKTACMIKSIQFKALGIVTVKANGNLTTGVIVAGATFATDKGNHNETQIASPNTSLRFAGLPDSISFYTIFKRGESGDYKANANFIIHGPVNYVDTYQPDYDNANKTNWVGEYLTASNAVSIAPSSDWVRNVQAVEYKTPSKDYDERYMLVSFTTNPKPGATKNDELTIDDIKFIYNSKLASVKIGGVAVARFDKNKSSYTIDANYDESIEIEYTTDAKAATVTKKFDSDKYTLTLIVEGNDISVNSSNKHEYVFQFNPPTPAVELIKSATYTDNIISIVNGEEKNDEGQIIVVDYYDNNTCDVTIKNLSINGTNAGDVKLTALDYSKKDSIHFSGTQNVKLGGSYALMGEVPVSVTASSSLSYDKLQALITVKVSAAASYDYKFGYEYIEPVKVLLTDTRSSCMQIDGGDKTEAEAKVTFYSNGTCDLKVADASFSELPYTLSENVYKVSTTEISLIYSKETLEIEAKNGGKVIEFGKCIVPKIIKSVTYTDYLKICENGKCSDPVLTKMQIDFYNTDVATIYFSEIDPTVTFDEIFFTKDDSIRFKSATVSGVGALSYLKAQILAEKDGKTYEFGYYVDETRDPVQIDKGAYYGSLHISVLDIATKNVSESVKDRQLALFEIYDNGTANLLIKNFKLDDQLIGDVTLEHLPYTADEDSIYISGSQITSIKSSNDKAVGPLIGDMEIVVKSASIANDKSAMKVRLEIDLSDNPLKQIVNVDFGFRRLVESQDFSELSYLIVGDSEGDEYNEAMSLDLFDNGEARMSIVEFSIDPKVVLGDVVIDGLTYKEDKDSIIISGEANVSIKNSNANGSDIENVPVQVSATVSSDYKYMKAIVKFDFTKQIDKNVVLNFGYRKPLVAKFSHSFVDTLIVSTEGKKPEVVENQSLSLTLYNKNYVTIFIKDFSFGGSLIGDVVLDSLKYSVDGDSVKISGKKNAVFSSSNPEAIGSGLGVVPISIVSASTMTRYSKLVAQFKMDLSKTINQTLDVSFGVPYEEEQVQDTTPVVPTPTIVANGSYEKNMNVYANGKYTNSADTKLDVVYYSDDYATVTIKEITYSGSLVGDIVIDSLPYKKGADSIRISGNRSVSITSADKEAVGPTLGKVNVSVVSATSPLDYKDFYATVSLDLKALLKQTIELRYNEEKPVEDTVPVKPEPKTAVYTDQLQVTVNGVSNDPMRENVTVVYGTDNTCSVSIKNFSMSVNGEESLVGDIFLDGLSFSMDKDSIRFSGKQTIIIKSDNPEAIGADLGKVAVSVNSASSSLDYKKLKMLMDIDLTKTLGQKVNVSFGYAKAVVPSKFTPGKAVYSDSLVVSVDGESAPAQMTDIIVDYAEDGTCTLSIMNFTMGSGDEALEVGDIIVPGVVYTVSDSVRLSGSKRITIDSEMGEMLGEIPVTLTQVASNIDKTKLVASIDIDMTESIGQIVNVKFGYTSLNSTPVVAFTPGKAVYSDSLVVSVDGESAPAQMTDIIVDYAEDGTCTLSIMNFTMGSGDEALEVGDIIVPGVVYSVSDSVRLSGSKRITIDSEMGEMLGEIPVTLTQVASNLGKTKLVASIDIDMTESIGQIVNVKFGYTSINTGGGSDVPVVVEVVDSVTYLDSIHISVNEKSCTDTDGEITVVFYSDNTAKMTIHNFSTEDENGVTLLGDATISGIKYSDTGDSIKLFKTDAKIKFESDDEDAVGKYLGEIYCQLASGSTNAAKTKLFAKFDFWLPNSDVAVSFGYEERTGIDTKLSEANEDGGVYTISGVYLGKDIDLKLLSTGLYIKNGAVVIVK